MSFGKLGDCLEEDALEFLADCLQAHHRRAKDPKAEKPQAGGDLLYELVRLQASQVSHLARFGLAHADYGRRVLESLYAGLATGRVGGLSLPDVVIGVKHKQTKREQRQLLIENRRGPDNAEFELRASCFRQTRTGHEFNHDVTLSPSRFKLASGAQRAVTLSLKIDPKLFMAGRSYEMVVSVHVGGRVAEERVVLVEVQ